MKIEINSVLLINHENDIYGIKLTLPCSKPCEDPDICVGAGGVLTNQNNVITSLFYGGIVFP